MSTVACNLNLTGLNREYISFYSNFNHWLLHTRLPTFMAAAFYKFAIPTSIITGSLLTLYTLQSSVGAKQNVGIVSFASYYGTAVLSASVVYPFLLRLIGRKYSLLLGDASAVIFAMLFLSPISEVTITIKAFVGLLETCIWAAAYTYASSYDSCGEGEETGNVAKFVTILSAAQAGMTILPIAILRNTASPVDVAQHVQYDGNETVNLVCGAVDCPSTYYSSKNDSAIYHYLIPSRLSLNILVGVFTLVQGGVLIYHIVFLPSDYSSNPGGERTNLLPPQNVPGDTTPKSRPVRAWRHLKESVANMFENLISVQSVFTFPVQVSYGLIAGFLWSGFARSFISCPLGVQTVGLCMLVANSVSAIVSASVVQFRKYISMRTLSALSLLVNLTTCTFAMLWDPSPATLYVPYLLSAMFGASYTVARLVKAIIPVIYFRDTDTAYSLAECWGSIGIMICQIISDELCTTSVLYVLAAFSMFSICVLIAGDCVCGPVQKP